MNFYDVQLPHLETFSKAAEFNSFTRAAKDLNLTQAAVSQHVRALEKTLSKSLFERKAGRVVLTEEGRKLYGFVQRILDLHRQARKEITGYTPPIVGELKIAASSVPGEHLLPALLSEFREKHPRLRVDAAVADSRTAVGQVERGDAHLGLVGQKTESPYLQFRFLATDRMMFIAPPDHAFVKRRRKTTVDQLAAEPLILRSTGSGLRDCLEKSLKRAGRSLGELRIALELGSNEAIKRAVLKGMGLAILSRYAVREELQAGKLKAFEVAGLRCDRKMYTVVDRRKVLPLPAQLFLSLLESTPIVRGS